MLLGHGTRCYGGPPLPSSSLAGGLFPLGLRSHEPCEVVESSLDEAVELF